MYEVELNFQLCSFSRNFESSWIWSTRAKARVDEMVEI